jgi:hypothetical protein
MDVSKVLRVKDELYHIDCEIKLEGKVKKNLAPIVRKYRKAVTKNLDDQDTYQKDDNALYDTIRAFYPEVTNKGILFVSNEKASLIGVFSDDYEPEKSGGKLSKDDLEDIIRPGERVLYILMTLHKKVNSSLKKLKSSEEKRKDRYENMWETIYRYYPETSNEDRQYVFNTKELSLKLVGKKLTPEEVKEYNTLQKELNPEEE